MPVYPLGLIRTTIERVDLTPRPDGSGLDAVLHGDLAAILAAFGEAPASGKQKLPGAGGRPGSQLSVVAGTRNHRCLHLLRTPVPRLRQDFKTLVKAAHSS
jgi:hypothetical protein